MTPSNVRTLSTWVTREDWVELGLKLRESGYGG